MPRRRKPQPKTVMSRISNQWDWHWRSLAAVVYLIILVFDFVAMPLYREITYNKMTVPQMVKTAQSTKDPASQVETLKILKEDRKWTPLTNDMLHLSFGAILGVAALPHNRRRRRRGQDNYEYDYGYESDDDCDDNEGGYTPQPQPYSPQPSYQYAAQQPQQPAPQPQYNADPVIDGQGNPSMPEDPPMVDDLPPPTGRME